MNVKDIRRQNLRKLARSIGGISVLAEKLGRGQPQISHLVSENYCKNIGDKLASLVEQTFNKPPGWLDREQEREPNNEERRTHSNAAYLQVPLIQRRQITHAITSYNALKNDALYIPVNMGYNVNTFAVKVDNDEMESEKGISFPRGSIIIIDPVSPYKSFSYVMAYFNNSNHYLFRQISVENYQFCFKPLNKKYPTLRIEPTDVKIIGVVRCMFMEIE